MMSDWRTKLCPTLTHLSILVECFLPESSMSHQTAVNPGERRVVTLNEAAEMLRISRGSAYEAAKRKEIPTIRIGRRLLVPAAALERMLAGDTGA
jgi:excisionase family DNA binding protein